MQTAFPLDICCGMFCFYYPYVHVSYILTGDLTFSSYFCFCLRSRQCLWHWIMSVCISFSCFSFQMHLIFFLFFWDLSLLSAFPPAHSVVEILYFFKFTEFFLVEINCPHFSGLSVGVYRFLGLFLWNFIMNRSVFTSFCFVGIVGDVREGVFYDSLPFCIKAHCHCILRLDFLFIAILISRSL